MKKQTSGKPSSPQRGSFGRGKPAFGGKSGDRKSGEGRPFDKRPGDKKPGRFSRDEGSTDRAESFGKAPSRYGKKSATGTERRPYEHREDSRKTSSSGKFDATKRPRRFDRNEEQSTRRERPANKDGARTFAKPDFHKRPEHKAAPTTNKSKFQPKRESLQRQGVLLWGLHAVREAWLNPARTCYRLWATESGLDTLEETILNGNSQGLTRPDAILSQKAEIEHFLPHNTVHQGVVLEVAPLPETTLDDLLGQEEIPQLIVILDQVTDPHNVGAILRSAAAFGAGAVIVTERNTPNATGVLAKTACGALEHVPLISVVNMARTLETLKNESFWCVGLAEEGDHDLTHSKLSDGRVALILGAEGEGLRRLTREHCDELARLPTQGPIGSLNVSNAAAISLYEARRQTGKLSTT